MAEMTKANNLLAEVGQSLYGSQWQTDLARELGITDRTVRRWNAGLYAIPLEQWARLRKIVLKRQATLNHVLNAMPR